MAKKNGGGIWEGIYPSERPLIAFIWGCIAGVVLAFLALYMGWCSPYPFGRY